MYLDAARLTPSLQVAWVLIYAVAGVLFLCRMKWIDERYDDHVKDFIAARARTDIENAAIKERRAAAEAHMYETERRQREENTFRSKVQKEIERQREINLALRAESEGQSAEVKAVSSVSHSVLEEAAPRYVEVASPMPEGCSDSV